MSQWSRGRSGLLISLEGTWAKLLTVPWLALTSIVTVLLLWTDRNHWVETGYLYQLVIGNRASVQILVPVLSSSLGAIHVYVLCVLVNFSTRLRFAKKPYKLDRLKFWTAICTRTLDWSVPFQFLIQLIIFQLLGLIPAAIWAGALTPVTTSTAIPFHLKLPQYSHASSGYWGNLNWTSPMLSKWAGAVFTYSPNYDLQGLMLNDAASATDIGNRARAHRKLDNTGYYYAARSYGVASSVGLVDHGRNTTAILGYRYNETGYHSHVSCIVSITSDWALHGPMYASDDLTYPDLYLANGTLPNGNSEVYSAYGLGNSQGIFALVGSRSKNGLHDFSIAAGQNYAAFDRVQCSLTFTPTVFSIAVNTTNGLIAVTPLSRPSTRASVPDIEPTGFITSFAMRIPTSISQQHACDLYTSLVGSTFVQNIQSNYADFRAADGDNATIKADVLRGVEGSLVSLLDNSLLALSSAQLMIAKDTFSIPISLSVRAIRVGEHVYIYIITGIQCTITLLWLIELIWTRMWKGLSKFDYTDIKSVIVGTSIGGDTIARRARKSHTRRQSWWSADPGDRVVGNIRVKLRSEEKDISLVGEGMEDGEVTESPLL